jgi:lipid-A-disaccharide synthase
MEVRQLLPVMLETLQTTPPAVCREAVLVEAPGMDEVVGTIVAEKGGDPRLQRVRGEGRRQELAKSEIAWTASGTATLECTLLDVPMVVGYRLRPASYALARLLVRVPHVALVNLIADRRVVPELLQSAWSSDRLYAATAELLEAGAVTQRAELATARSRLGGPGASRRAAEAIAEYLE